MSEIEHEQEVRSNHVYIGPPHKYVRISNNRFLLKSFETKKKGAYLPVDYFFRALAFEYRDRAFGVILTGSGTDGTLGIKEIKSQGGFTIAQDPETAEFNSMPLSAIESGVDLVLQIKEIPPRILDFCNCLTTEDKPFPDDDIERQINRIYELLKKETEYDFSKYKRNTIYRRLRRRMVIYRYTLLKEYADFLEKKPEEVEKLFKELLIGVTSFFRDMPAFKSLEENVLPEIFSQKKSEPVRIWVAACSTGEEAYSIAILVSEYMEKNNIRKEIQMFASDIDKDALEIARYGQFRENNESDVPTDILKKYFTKKDAVYQIKKDIRDTIVFAEHSIIKDPPYSRLDLISCRNFLIYLDSGIQKHVLNTLHYALRFDGYLFLGSFESQGNMKDMFLLVNLKNRIYKKIENRHAITDYLLQSKGAEIMQTKPNQRVKSPKREVSVKEFAEKTALKEYLHPFMIVDKQGELLYTLGKSDKYFTLQAGEPTNNIVNLAREGLKVPLSNALRKLHKNGKRLKYENIKVLSENGEETIDIFITPVLRPVSFNNFLIINIQPPSTVPEFSKEYDSKVQRMSEDSDEYIWQMEQELSETREYLQNVVEELETSNEELKSANEEARSSNEELQSANEELESSKEEMQSLNEELETSNNELQRKIDEISRINNDLNNFLHSTQIGTLFLDKNLNIKRFTAPVRKIINLVETDIDRSIEDFGIKAIDIDLISHICHVLESLVPVEKEVATDSDKQYWMRILPYRTLQDSIDGVVITFTDITEKNRIQKLIAEKDKKYKLLFNNMDNGFALIKADRNKKGLLKDYSIIEVNQAFKTLTGIEQDNFKNMEFGHIFHDKDFEEDLFQTANKALNNKPFQEERYFEQLGKHFRIHYFSYDEGYFAILLQDITRIKNETETRLHLASIVESSEDAIFSESPGGEILSWNDGALQLYGYEEKEAVGKNAGDLYAYPKSDGDKALIEKVAKGEKVKNHETVHKTKDGNIVPVSITKSPIKDTNGVVVAISNIVKDMTQVIKREEELKRAKKASEQASNLKAAFLANMSHEIRTPLNSILGLANMLKKRMTDNEQIKHMDTINRSGNHLLNIINDIVDISRLEANGLSIHPVCIHVNTLLKRLKDQFEGYAANGKKDNIDFRLNFEDNTDKLYIKCDEYRLQQILSNLISNAYKYTEKGYIEVGYKVRNKEDILFYVKDTGIGIEKEYHKKIFERFSQGSDSPTKVMKGTGLGLSISKGLTLLMGGEIWVESEKGKGSVFYFTIPYQEDVAENMEEEEEETDNRLPDLTGKKILIAEDDIYSLELIKYMLLETHADIVIATDGEEAIKEFNNDDFIFLDIRLPHKDGYEIIKEIRAKNKDIPVVAQTAYAMPEEIKKSKKLGFSGYITKPVMQDDLNKLLHRMFIKEGEGERS